MPEGRIVLPSLDPVVNRIVGHLTTGLDTALVSAPGCGTTTLLDSVLNSLRQHGVEAIVIDFRASRGVTDAVATLGRVPAIAGSMRHRVIVIDHAATLLPDELQTWSTLLQGQRQRLGLVCLWLGPLDSRALAESPGINIHAVPKSHITFPLLPRDELLAVYQAIAAAKGCRWGEAILFLLLDLCGNDLSLVARAAEYLYGDWSDRLYDATIWDRVSQWLARDTMVDWYRQRLTRLPEPSRKCLRLIRLGGKPPCPRLELLEEIDARRRLLCLQGFLIPNLLPGFYQLRNLTVRFLLYEPFRPDALIRRATNERVSQLLQDVEMTLRSVLFSVFSALGENPVQTLLSGKQGDATFITPELNRVLLEWAGTEGSAELKESLNRVLVAHRTAFKESNSVWWRVSKMMDEEPVDAEAIPRHLRCIEYLTFAELGDLVITLLDQAFPVAAGDGARKASLKSRWQEGLSKVRRLRNQVAHLRNVGFQDMEDLVGTVESMRKDLIEFSAWR